MDILTFIKTSIPRFLFLTFVALATLAGTVHTAVELAKYREARRQTPFAFYGDTFAGLRDALRGEKYVGYYTDKDIRNPLYGAQFAQVQLSLAPVILDISASPDSKAGDGSISYSTARRFVLFDCRNVQECQRKISAMGARPLKRNNLGAILAVTTLY